MVKRRPEERVFFGWRELVDLPEWGASGIRAKVDTGARTSALHVEDLSEIEDGRVRFVVPAREGDVEVTAPIVRRSRVRPSSGKLQERFVVESLARIGATEKRIEISLVSRERMLCAMLIGRNGLLSNAQVDPHHMYLHGRGARRRTGKSDRAPARRPASDRDASQGTDRPADDTEIDDDTREKSTPEHP